MNNTYENNKKIMNKEHLASKLPAITDAEKALFIDTTNQIKELQMLYNSAIREVTTKLEILNEELSMKNERNPIEFITSRVKTPASIIGKLQRKNLNITLRNIKEHINDAAGVRVVCSFIDDIYEIANMLIRQDDIKLLEVKDYIQNPKANGYRSLHLIIQVPVFLSENKKFMKVEIQIRTMAMDFWASLEHDLKYKQDIENEFEINKELKECAEIISNTDFRMLNIRDKIKHKPGADKSMLNVLKESFSEPSKLN